MALRRLLEQDETQARIPILKEKQAEIEGPIFAQWKVIQGFLWGVLLRNCVQQEIEQRPRPKDEENARRELIEAARRDWQAAKRAEEARIRRELEAERKRRLREEQERLRREREEARRRREELRKQRREEARRRRQELEQERRKLPPHLRAELDRVRRRIGVAADGVSGDKAAESANYRGAGEGDVRHGLLDFAARLIAWYNTKKGDVVDELCENLRFPPGRSSAAARQSCLALIANSMVANPDIAESFGTALAELLVLRQYTQKPIDIDRDLGFDDVPPPPRTGEDPSVALARAEYERRYNNWDWAESQTLDGVEVQCRNGSLFGPVCAALRDQGPGGGRGAWSEQILKKWIKWTCLVSAVCCADADGCADPDDELWRGLGGGGLPGAVVENHRKLGRGSELGWPALSSTSFDEHASKEYMWGIAVNSTGQPNENRPGTILFRISGVRTGKVLQPLSQYPAERELLLGPLTVFRIDNCAEEPRNAFRNAEGQHMGLNIDMHCLGPTGQPLAGTELGDFFAGVREAGDAASVKLSLTAAADAAGWTALHAACDDESLDTILDLLDAGANAAATGDGGVTPLHVAVQNPIIEAAASGREVIERLAQKEVLHAADSEGRTALVLAASCGHARVVCWLAALGADPLHADCAGRLPLHYLAECGGGADPALFDAAIAAVAPPAALAAADSSGSAPLELAIRQGHVQVAAALLRAPGAANAAPGALHACADSPAFDQGGGYDAEWRDVVRRLATPRSLRRLDRQGLTALERAVHARRTHLVGELLDAGADSAPLFRPGSVRRPRTPPMPPPQLPPQVPRACPPPVIPAPPPAAPAPPKSPPQPAVPLHERTAADVPLWTLPQVKTPPSQPNRAPEPAPRQSAPRRPPLPPPLRLPADPAPPPQNPPAAPRRPSAPREPTCPSPDQPTSAPAVAAAPPRAYQAAAAPAAADAPPRAPPAPAAPAPAPAAAAAGAGAAAAAATRCCPPDALLPGRAPHRPSADCGGACAAAERLAGVLAARAARGATRSPPPYAGLARPHQQQQLWDRFSRGPSPCAAHAGLHPDGGAAADAAAAVAAACRGAAQRSRSAPISAAPAPAPAPIDPGQRDRLIRFFEAYDRDKLPSVVSILRQFAGHEAALFAALIRRYGAEPPDTPPPPLPPGWRRVISSRGDLFYQDKSRRKQWARPRGAV